MIVFKSVGDAKDDGAEDVEEGGSEEVGKEASPQRQKRPSSGSPP